MAWAALGKAVIGGAKAGAKKIATDKLLNRKKKPAARKPTLDELIADVRGSGEPTKGGELAVRPTTSLVPSPGGSIQKHTGREGEYGSIEDNVIRIKSKVIAVDSILKGTLAAQKARKADQRKAQEQADASGAEAGLEGKKKKKKGLGLKKFVPKVAMNAWQKMINFFQTMVLGYVALQLLPLLPQLLKFVEGLSNVIGWVTDIGLGLFTALTTLVDWGYKLYDMGMGFVKNIAGEEGAKKIEQFMGVIGDLVKGFLVWKIIGKKIFESIVKSVTRIFRIARIILKKALRFGKKALQFAANIAKNIISSAKNIASRLGKNLMKIPGVKNIVGKVGRIGGNILKTGANVLTKGKGLLSKGAGLLSKGGGAAAGKVGGLAAKFLGPAAKALGPVMKVVGPGIKKFASRIPILGPIIVAVVSIMSGDSLAQALFKGVGAALGGALGATLAAGITAATVGIGALLAPAMTMLGELLGTFVGDLLFELFMGGGFKGAMKKLKGALGGIFKGIFNAGKAVFNFFKDGFGRFISTFPMVKFPETGIGTMLAKVLSINPIYKALLGWKVPGWKVIPKAIRGFSLGKLLDSLPNIPQMLGFIFNMHPLLKGLVKDGKVEGFPAVWQLMNPAFMINHLKESFFPSKGGATAASTDAAAGGAGEVGEGMEGEKEEKKMEEDSSSDLVLDENQGDNDRKIFELEQRRAEIIDSNNWENTKEIENHPDIKAIDKEISSLKTGTQSDTQEQKGPKPEGMMRGLAGAADFLTGGFFDFDKRGDSKLDTARKGMADFVTGGMFDFDKKGDSKLDTARKGAMDFVTGGVFDFDKKGDSKLDNVRKGMMDFATGGLTDLDGKGGKPFGAARVLAGAGDVLTGNRFDFDRHGEKKSLIESLNEYASYEEGASQTVVMNLSDDGGDQQQPIEPQVKTVFVPIVSSSDDTFDVMYMR